MLIGLGAVQSAADRATLVSYQQRSGKLPMSPHGHPDPNTLINQGVYDPMDHWPDSQVRYIEDGDKTGTFMRDLAGVNNQVPQWAWLVLSGTCLILAGLAYRRHKKEGKSGKKRK